MPGLFSRGLWGLDPDTPISDYINYRWNVENGFISDNVDSIIQTPDGYLWVGTWKGLIRHDGLGFQLMRYDKRVDHQLEDMLMLGFLVDGDGGLIIGGEKALYRYSRGKFDVFDPPREAIRLNRTMAMDRRGRTWTGSMSKGLYRFDYRSGKDHFIHVPMLPDGKDFSTVEDICPDSRGNLWLCVYHDGLLKGDGNRFKKVEIKGITKRFKTYCAMESSPGVMWVGTTEGLVRIKANRVQDQRLFTRADGLPGEVIYCMITDSDGQIWVGTNKGVARLKQLPGGKTIIEAGPWDVLVRTIYEDREKNIWFGGWGMGLMRLSNRVFKNHWTEKGIPDNYLSIYRDSRDNIWLGTMYGSIYLNRPHSPQKGKESPVFEKVSSFGDHTHGFRISSMAGDSNGNLWFGTYMGAPYRLIWKNGKYELDKSLVHRACYFIFYTDPEGNFWCEATGRRFFVFPADGSAPVEVKHPDLSVYIMKAIRDKYNNIWLTGTHGLHLYPNGQWKNTAPITFFNTTDIRDIYIDKDGVYWLGTGKEGLWRFELKNNNTEDLEKRVIKFTPGSGFPVANVFRIMEDRRGNFWIASGSGILKMPKRGLNEMAAGKFQKFDTAFAATVFGFSDGLASLNCTETSICNAVETPDGEFWFGTQHGIAAVHPDKVKISRLPVPVVMKSAVFGGEPVSVYENNRAFKGVGNMRFYFTAPSFESPEKILFKYRLEGYEEQWHTLDIPNERSAFYKDVPFGNYRFHVIARGSRGTWNRKGASFRFTLEPYFYQTLLFKIALIAAIIFLFIAMYIGLKKYLYIRKLKQKYKSSTLDPQKTEAYLDKILHLVEREKVYLDEELTLSGFAEKLSIAPRYLSQVINERLNKNFRDFINGYRIEDAKAMLEGKKEPGASIQDIGSKAGFSSKEVFSRTFKRYTGMTPSEYRNSASAAKPGA